MENESKALVVSGGRIIPYNDEHFIAQVNEFKEYWRKHYDYVSGIGTLHKAKPRDVGGGKEELYLPEQFMRSALDKYFPGWSWTPAHEPIIIANRGIVSSGVLEIIDVSLFKYQVMNGIPESRAEFKRRFLGLGGSIIQSLSSTGQVANATWAISNPAKIANTEALKYSINRLSRFGDDTYGKDDSDIGLTEAEYYGLATMIMESKMPIHDKQMAMQKLKIVTSSDIEKFKKLIKSKEITENE